MPEATQDNVTDTTQGNTNVDQTSKEQQTPATEEPQDAGFAGGEEKEAKEPEGFEDGKETADKEGEEKAPEGAPESYEKFEIEEGFDITDDEFKSVAEISKELNLSQEQAQKMVNLKVSIDKARQEQLQKDQADETLAWQKETRKELGDKYSEEIAIGKKAHDTFMPKGFRDFLVKTGLVHHPDYIRGMIKIGKSISEDTFVKGDTKVKGKNEGGLKTMFSDLDNKT
jgi:hypothetical protein